MWQRDWSDTTLVISVWDMTPDEAGQLARRHEMGSFHFAPDLLDDLILRASGLNFGGQKQEQKEAKCTVCSKMFPALRSSAMYCSDACRLKAGRRNRLIR